MDSDEDSSSEKPTRNPVGRPRKHCRPRVTRPPNAFMLFGRDRRPLIAKDHPTLSNKDVSKLLGQHWHALTPEDKEKYYAMAKELRDKHKENHPDYNYCPKEARKEKAEKKRKRKEKVLDFSSMLSAQLNKELNTDQNYKEFFIPPPEYQDIQLDGPYEKFIHYKGQIIPWREWEEKHSNVAITTQSVMMNNDCLQLFRNSTECEQPLQSTYISGDATVSSIDSHNTAFLETSSMAENTVIVEVMGDESVLDHATLNGEPIKVVSVTIQPNEGDLAAQAIDIKYDDNTHEYTDAISHFDGGDQSQEVSNVVVQDIPQMPNEDGFMIFESEGDEI